MGLLFDVAKLKAETNAIGDSLDFDQLSAVMSSVYGDQIINAIANEKDPRRTVAEKCIRYADRHGMIAHVFLDVARRTEAADALRSRLTTAVRQAFSPYVDVGTP